jgi:hypothetical protein
MPKYYIICASRDHIQTGFAGGFVQANHGKKTGLQRLKKGIAIRPKITLLTSWLPVKNLLQLGGCGMRICIKV